MVPPATLKDLTATVPVKPAARPRPGSSADWVLSEMIPAVSRSSKLPQNGTLGNFLLLEEIGQGAEGQVYVGQQLDLGNRLVVLKITAATGGEHLSLARLQHTNIVPLFGMVEDADHRQRALCMPYFGRATLKHIFEGLGSIPCHRRQGKDLLAVLDRVDQAPAPVADSPARSFLRGASYIQAICSIGAALADALHYAHERGLVHLDVKPSNVLLAGDGQPMLLDFHLARAPLMPGDDPPHLFGGTPAYMAPEQHTACQDISAIRPISQSVDARADIFALGMVLYEALSAKTPSVSRDGSADLRQLNPQVSVGLADIVGKCLAPDADERYASAAAVAEDLRCHVQDRPLQGVPNRSWPERWRKWRRRRPHALLLVVLVTALLGAVGGATFLSLERLQKRRQLADEFFVKGRDLLQQQQFAAARENLNRGLELIEGLGSLGANPALTHALHEHLRLAERAAEASKLHLLADSLRLFMLFPNDDQRTLIVLDVGCRQVWEKRALLLSDAPPLLEPLLEQRLRRDLGDLAVGWAELKVRLAPPGRAADRRQEALALLTEATSWGANFPELEWQLYQPASYVKTSVPAKTAWEHYLSGRCLFRAGKYQAAIPELEEGVHLEPADFYGNFCLGVCAARLNRHAQAVSAFSVCIGQDPLRTEPFLYRGRSYARLRDWQQALADFNRALLIKPNVPELVLERARANFHLGLRDQAKQDLTLILQLHPQHPEAQELLKIVK